MEKQFIHKRTIMSKYSEYHYAFTSTVAHLREINQVLTLLKNAKIKREEPVPDYVGNKKSNINLANRMIEIVKQRYEVAIQYINASGIMPTGWIPSFEELKNIAETAENEDT